MTTSLRLTADRQLSDLLRSVAGRRRSRSSGCKVAPISKIRALAHDKAQSIVNYSVWNLNPRLARSERILDLVRSVELCAGETGLVSFLAECRICVFQ